MGEIHTFRSRRLGAVGGRALRDGSALRAELERAAQSALDVADHIIAVLDDMGGNPDDEDGGDAEPSLGALEGRESQVVWLRGSDRDLELTSPEDR